MARKEAKKTLREIYAEILSKPSYDGRITKPLSLNQVVILGYKLPDDIHVNAYYYDLLNAGVQYLLFDGYSDGRVNVLFKQGRAK